MTTSVALPEVGAVGRRAAELFGALTASPRFGRLGDSSKKYADCWATFTGFMTITEWDEQADREPLFVEAMRVLTLKAAVFELTDGDEQAAELMVSAPVDEMVHAVLAQATLCSVIARETGMVFVHMTDTEEFGWKPGDYTEQCYRAAGFGDLNTRYWIPKDEYHRRLTELKARYDSIGIQNLGRQSTIDFADNREGDLVGVGA